MLSLLPFAHFSFPYDVVISHGPCRDGYMAAWCVWRLLPTDYRASLATRGGFYAKNHSSSLLPKNSDYVSPTSFEGALNLQKAGYPVVFCFTGPQPKPVDGLLDGKRVLILDMDVGDAFDNFISKCEKIRHIDHHKSGSSFVEKSLKTFPDKYSARFDIDKTVSGCSLTWMEFYPDQSIPAFLTWVQIGDTWNWQQDPSLDVKAIVEAMYALQVFESFHSLEDMFQKSSANPNMAKELEISGKAILKYQDDLCLSVASHSCLAKVTLVDGTTTHLGLVVNSGTLNSHVGNWMDKFASQLRTAGVPVDFCAVWAYYWSDKDSKITVSLRSPGPGIDLSVMAKSIAGNGKLGGGGHPAASGFSIDGLNNLNNIFVPQPYISLEPLPFPTSASSEVISYEHHLTESLVCKAFYATVHHQSTERRFLGLMVNTMVFSDKVAELLNKMKDEVNSSISKRKHEGDQLNNNQTHISFILIWHIEWKTGSSLLHFFLSNYSHGFSSQVFIESADKFEIKTHENDHFTMSNLSDFHKIITKN